MIGNLGEEIKQHSNPFANLSQRGIRRARINALKAIILDLDPDGSSNAALPHGARDVREGFIFLQAREDDPCPLHDCEAAALREYLGLPPSDTMITVHRWAKLRIPTRQNCYSAWKEKEKLLELHRTARNTKVSRVS